MPGFSKDFSACRRFYSQNSTYSSTKTMRESAKMQVLSSDRVNFDRLSLSQVQTVVDSGVFRPIYFGSNQHNEKVAVHKRVLEQPAKYDIVMTAAFVQFVKSNLHKFIKIRKLESVSIETYLNNSNSSPTVKAAVFAADTKLKNEGIVYDRTSKKNAYEFTKRKSFVKVENNCYGSETQSLTKAPRLIQGATPEFVSVVGPFFQSFQSYFKSKWNEKHFIYYTCGATNVKMGNYIDQRENWQKLEDDVGSWDASLNEHICALEVWIAKRFGASPLCLQLMVANIQTHGYTQNGLRYKVNGTRKSGDPYTSVMNSIINAMLHLFVFHFIGDVPIDQLQHNMRMLVQGDDNLLLHSGPRINFKDTMLALGFVTVSKYRDHKFQLEFCSAILVDSNLGSVFVPKIGRVIMKFGYFINPPPFPSDQVIRGVAFGMQHLCGVDIFKSFLKPYLTPGKSITPKQFEHKFIFSTGVIADSSNLKFRYDFSDEMWNQVKQQLELQNYQHPYVRALFDRDTDGIKTLYCNTD